MNQITSGAKIPVNMTLDADLVEQASALTPDLSQTVTTLLAAFVARERAKRDNEQRGIDAVIAATNDFIEKHGLPGADYSPL